MTQDSSPMSQPSPPATPQPISRQDLQQQQQQQRTSAVPPLVPITPLTPLTSYAANPTANTPVQWTPLPPSSPLPYYSQSNIPSQQRDYSSQSPGQPQSQPESQSHVVRPTSPLSSMYSQSDTTRTQFRGNRMFMVHNSDDQQPSSHDAAMPEVPATVIWGTNVNVNETIEKFHTFILTFVDVHSTEPKYVRLIEQIVQAQLYNINIDCRDLFEKDPELYRQLVAYPQEIIPIFDMVLHEYLKKNFEWQDKDRRVQVRTFNLQHSKNMRDLNPSDIDQMVSIRGMATRVSGVMPDLKQAFFQCLVCSFTLVSSIDRGRINEPSACPNCQTLRSLNIVHNRCLFSDKQMVKLQEAPENIPEGETPHTVILAAFDELVDAVTPGDRIEVTGIYRAMPLRTNPNRRTLKAVYKTYIDVIHFGRVDKRKMNESEGLQTEQSNPFESEVENTEAQKALEEKLLRLSQSPNIYDRLAKALAPSIWELDDVKKGLLCQMFGGTNKSFGDASRQKFRGDINVLLVGDPGTSKSQLLQFVHKIAPRGVYTSGKGSSAVGLTASVLKDVDTGELALESGALVLSDRGICCIDEFDKMSDSTRAVLHEVMEQQTVSIAKAGIICTLNARTSILAAANPIGSRYDAKLSVVANINLPPTLLSRFDMIYLILDKPDATNDRHLAKHLVSLYFKEHQPLVDEEIDTDTLASYVSYARKKIQPEISDESVQMLIDGYLDMRRMGGNKKTITATPRQLESLIRIAEAHARIRLSRTVDPVDVTEAIRLVRVALQQSAMDPRTGTIDMDLIATGKSASGRSRIRDLAEEIRRYILEKGASTLKGFTIHKDISERLDLTIPYTDIESALYALKTDEFIHITGEGRNLTIRKLV
eukprot:TRINITY_DN3657_c0_g2_i2.p1 TRINITY_DN3657_c0_g2~~TRINITY_DN3657_c0_g2_i2.p1  ORF type:complete len:875 (-),score=175.55 TRINITY_DN3657_c0_g2_i2:279-2903(-)